MIELVAATVVALAVSSPHPNFRLNGDHWEIGPDRGGVLSGYKQAFDNILGTGLDVRVMNLCASACTLVLANPRTCAATEWTQFGFHRAYDVNRVTRAVLGQSSQGTQELWDSYPAKVKARLGKLTPEMVFIKGTELLPACK